MVVSLKDYSPPFELEIQDLPCQILARKTQHKKFALNFPAKILYIHFVLQRSSVKRGENGLVDFERPNFLQATSTTLSGTISRLESNCVG